MSCLTLVNLASIHLICLHLSCGQFFRPALYKPIGLKECILFARQLNHPFIVTFYGTNLQHGENRTKVMIVLELCSCSLRSHVMSHQENAPARLHASSEAVKKKVLGWALNILDALRSRENEGTEREAPGPALGICHVHESYII